MGAASIAVIISTLQPSPADLEIHTLAAFYLLSRGELALGLGNKFKKEGGWTGHTSPLTLWTKGEIVAEG